MHPKDHYKNYLADDTISPLSEKLIERILLYKPTHALDFGGGSGKHSNMLEKLAVSSCSLDLSFNNISKAHFTHDLPLLIKGDETHLRHLANFDVVFTCSVLDHIEDVANIIGELQRIANKAVILAETNSLNGNFYYRHIYEMFGFDKIDFEWESDSDGAIYQIWEWRKGELTKPYHHEIGNSFVTDDLA